MMVTVAHPDSGRPLLDRHPGCLAAIIIVGIAFFALVAVSALQPFSVTDTTCHGTLGRLVTGGPFTNPDRVCAARETVRFWVSVAVIVVAIGTAIVVAVGARRSALRRGSSENRAA